MKQVTVVLVALFLMAVAPVALPEALKMSVGTAQVAGSVRFTLASGEATLDVEVALEPMSAADKAAALSAAVAAQDPSGTWRGVATGAALTFEHAVEGVFSSVDSVSDISDTTGSGTGLAKNDGDSVKFKLAVDEDAVASGVDAGGNPSFITVSVTDTLTWTHPIPAGETAGNIVDLLYAYLLEQGGSGVQVTRTAATSIEIQLSYDSASLSWQITDTALKPKAKGSGKDAGVIDR
jgi:hypothetical protein